VKVAVEGLRLAFTERFTISAATQFAGKVEVIMATLARIRPELSSSPRNTLNSELLGHIAVTVIGGGGSVMVVGSREARRTVPPGEDVFVTS